MRARRVWLATLGAIGSGSLAYVFVVRGVLSPGTQPAEGLGWPLFATLPLYAFGMWLLTATSSRAALYVAIGGTGSALGSAYETFVWTHLDVLHWSGFALLNQVGLAADALSAIGFLLMVATFPDGILERAWQRVAVGLVWLQALVGPVTLLVSPHVVMPQYISIDGSSIPNPYAVPALEPLWPAVENAVGQWWLLPGLALAVFYSRGLFGRRAMRVQMRFMVVAVTCALGTYMLWESATVAGIDDTPFGTAMTLAVAASMVALPVAGIHGILRYGAYDVAVADRGRVVVRSSTTLITILYVWAVAAPGLLLSEALAAPAAVLLTAAMAVALLPARAWLSRTIRRVALGDREEHLDLLADFGSRLEQAVDVGDVLERLALAVRDGLGATWVRISLAPGGSREDEALHVVAGTVSGAPATGTDLSRGDRVVGRIDVGPARSGAYSAAELSLLDTVARQAATAVANVRLTAELADQLDELTASRTRLITAQDAERRRIERDLHDGIQQSVVALVAGLRLARNRNDRGDLRSGELADLQDQAREILADLRELAHGIHPQVLVDRGLVAAVESRTTRFPVPLTIDADAEVRGRRFGPDVEAVAFYTIREALTNVAKHAGATSVRVALSLTREDPTGRALLRVEVHDDGAGLAGRPGDPGRAAAHPDRAGLANIRDRVAAIDGTFRLESAPGSGTSLVVELPVLPTAPQPVAEPSTEPATQPSTQPSTQPQPALVPSEAGLTATGSSRA